VSNLKRAIPPEYSSAQAQSRRLQERIIQLSDNVRRLSHQLHPAALEHSGLAAALRAYCSEFQALTGVHVSLRTLGSFESVTKEAAVCLYRITQEALQNVLKHANVGEAIVTLERSEGALSLTIADEGVGMTTEARENLVGLGLVSIKERTRLVNGTMELRSAPNEGTTLRIRVPEPIGALTNCAEA
jgi:signal transduction histidine kinase